MGISKIGSSLLKRVFKRVNTEGIKAAEEATLKQHSPLYQEAYKLNETGLFDNSRRALVKTLPSGTRIEFSNAYGSLQKTVITKDGRKFVTTFDPKSSAWDCIRYTDRNLIEYGDGGINYYRNGHLSGDIFWKEFTTKSVGETRYLVYNPGTECNKRIATAEKSAQLLRKLFDFPNRTKQISEKEFLDLYRSAF